MLRPLAVVLFSVGALASLAEAAGPIWITGQGTLSCGALSAVAPNSETSNPEQYFGFESWIDGYLSASNDTRATYGQRGTTGDGIDPPGRDAWILNYCRAHPLEPVFKAAEALARELAKTNP